MSIEEQFQQVEQKYGLVLPDAYKSMYVAGWMDVKGDNWFWLWDAEWMPAKKMLSYKPKKHQKSGFVPFATTAGRDYWSWWPSEHPEAIVCCPHDSENGVFFAPSFVGFVYRELLEFATQVGLNSTDNGFDPECDPLQAQALQDSAARLTPYLPDAWRRTLEEIAVAIPTRITNNGKDIGSALLTEEQYQAIVQRDLAFPLLDEKFQWMQPTSNAETEYFLIQQKVMAEADHTLTFNELMAGIEAEKARRKGTK